MREVAVVSFAQSSFAPDRERSEVEVLAPVLREALAHAGLERSEIGFVCSGSSDYLAGQPFSFVMALDAVGAWPPVCESHVEMDAAFALYEAWVKLQTGDADAALVYGSGTASAGDLAEVLALQLDPYVATPLWPDAVSLAALQARALLDAGEATERAWAEVAVRARRDAQKNPAAHVAGDFDVEALLAEPALVAPLRRHACPPVSDGAAAVVVAAGDLARRARERPAWIRGLDHRIEAQDLGARDLTRSASAARAAAGAGAARARVDVAELHAPFAPQEAVLREALGLGEGAAICPSGGALAANPMMAAGLVRVGEAARRVWSGEAERALAHATSGPCLQQNLVCVLEGEG